MNDPQLLKAEILRLTREYSRQVHSSFRPALDPERKPWMIKQQFLMRAVSLRRTR